MRDERVATDALATRRAGRGGEFVLDDPDEPQVGPVLRAEIDGCANGFRAARLVHGTNDTRHRTLPSSLSDQLRPRRSRRKWGSDRRWPEAATHPVTRDALRSRAQRSELVRERGWLDRKPQTRRHELGEQLATCRQLSSLGEDDPAVELKDDRSRRGEPLRGGAEQAPVKVEAVPARKDRVFGRSEEHTSELQSRQ